MEQLTGSQLAQLKPLRRLKERADAGTWLLEIPGGQRYVRKSMPTPFLALRARSLFTERLRTLAAMHHPHIAGVTAGWVQRTLECAVVTEYAPRGSLFDAVAAPDGRLWTLPMPPMEALRLIHEAGAGVQALHTNGLMHGGLKLANMLLFPASDGLWHAKVTDALLHEGFVNGTLRTGTARPTDLSDPWRYVAPEQYAQHPDLASDQYALGVIAFLLLTGESPYPIDPIAYLQVREAPPMRVASNLNPVLPVAADGVLARALQRAPRARYASMRDFTDALTKAFGQQHAPQAMTMLPGSIPTSSVRGLETVPVTQPHEVMHPLTPLALRTESSISPIPGLPDLPAQYRWADEVVSAHSQKLPIAPAVSNTTRQRRHRVPTVLIASVTTLLVLLLAVLALLLMYH